MPDMLVAPSLSPMCVEYWRWLAATSRPLASQDQIVLGSPGNQLPVTALNASDVRCPGQPSTRR